MVQNTFEALNGLTVNELMDMRNFADAIISARNNKIMEHNTPILMGEIMNLLDGVGKGYTAGDYYAPNRYYSSINGVKNIRVDKCYPNGYGNPSVPCILVKIEGSEGGLLPKEVEIRGVKYPIELTKSQHYTDEVNY